MTPEGIEEEYFEIFDKYIVSAGLNYGDMNYIKAKEYPVELLQTTIAQYVYSPAFEYVVRGDVVDILVDGDKVVITIEYSEN